MHAALAFEEATMTPVGSTAKMPDPQALEARPAVARIAAFAAATRPEHLAPDVLQLLKRNILGNAMRVFNLKLPEEKLARTAQVA